MVTATERDQARRREEAEVTVGPLLARANLYRLRGQWNEAVAVCTEALRVAPQSPTAHSLLGDIYEAQGKLDDAIQWFGMAVDLNPGNAPDRVKLDRVVHAKRSSVASEARKNATIGSPTLSPAQKEKTLDRTIEWFDKTFPPGRSDSIVRLILLVAAAIAGVIALSAAFVYFTISRERTVEAPPPAAPSVYAAAGTTQSLSGSGSNFSAAPVVVTPTPGPSATAPSLSSSLHSPPPSQPSSLPAASSSPKTVAVSLDANSRMLAEAIRNSLGLTISFQGAQSTGGVVQVSLELATQILDETPEHTRERILRAAAQAARTAAVTDTQSQKSVISVALLGGAPAFRGEAAASVVRAQDPAFMSINDLGALFTMIQWGAGLTPTATEAPNK